LDISNLTVQSYLNLSDYLTDTRFPCGTPNIEYSQSLSLAVLSMNFLFKSALKRKKMSSILQSQKIWAAKVRATKSHIQTFLETFFQQFLHILFTTRTQDSVSTEAGAKVRALLTLQTGVSKFFSFFFNYDKAKLLFETRIIPNLEI